MRIKLMDIGEQDIFQSEITSGIRALPLWLDNPTDRLV